MLPAYSKGVRRLLSDAHVAAGRYRHRHIHTEYLLLGLLEERNSATRVLKRLGVDREEIRRSCEANCDYGDHTPRRGNVMDAIQRMTPRVQQVMAIAGEEMESLGHDSLDSRHVLLGILQEDHGIAGDVLRRHGITVETVRDAITAEDNGTAPPLPETHTVDFARHSAPKRGGWRIFGRA